jgi:heat shock protein HslJ
MGRMREYRISTRTRYSILALTIATGVLGLPRSAASSFTLSVSALSGTAWQLVDIRAGDNVTTPIDGQKYTVTFGADKRALIRADCNRGVASWHSTDDDLMFGAVKMTRVKCADGSMHQRFVNDLAYVRWYAFQDGHLYLSLNGDAGAIELAPMTP